jgi:hypothetical protein
MDVPCCWLAPCCPQGWDTNSFVFIFTICAAGGPERIKDLVGLSH